METNVASFQIDHNLLERGVYISRRDDPDLVTYDIRLRRPNRENPITPEVAHTLEHLGAFWFRNYYQYCREVVYFGIQGCFTGLYLILHNPPELKEVVSYITDFFEFVADYEGKVPGASPVECGNYTFMDLDSAKEVARDFLDTLYNLSSTNLIYPKGLPIPKDRLDCFYRMPTRETYIGLFLEEPLCRSEVDSYLEKTLGFTYFWEKDSDNITNFLSNLPFIIGEFKTAGYSATRLKYNISSNSTFRRLLSKAIEVIDDKYNDPYKPITGSLTDISSRLVSRFRSTGSYKDYLSIFAEKDSKVDEVDYTLISLLGFTLHRDMNLITVKILENLNLLLTAYLKGSSYRDCIALIGEVNHRVLNDIVVSLGKGKTRSEAIQIED